MIEYISANIGQDGRIGVRTQGSRFVLTNWECIEGEWHNCTLKDIGGASRGTPFSAEETGYYLAFGARIVEAMTGDDE